jgi:sulfur-oxidizing protein SoxY
MQRRGFLARVIALAVSLPPLFAVKRAAADTVGLESIVPAIRDTTKGADIKPGKIKLQIPRLADNGNSVAGKLMVESPMTPNDFVRGIYLFSEKSPRPVIARFHLGPEAGRAEITTRIRLAGTQRVVAIAELSNGSFWSDVEEVAVTLSACLDGT